MQQNNLAARAGRWSAHHRKRAILGWIAFVILATVLGGAVGQRMLADEDMGNGESRAADQAVAAAGFPKESGEQVLVEAKGGKLASQDGRFRAAWGNLPFFGSFLTASDSFCHGFVEASSMACPATPSK